MRPRSECSFPARTHNLKSYFRCCTFLLQKIMSDGGYTFGPNKLLTTMDTMEHSLSLRMTGTAGTEDPSGK